MPKVVILSPAHPLRGGIASSSERLAQEFQVFGYEVIMYSFSLQYPSFLFPGKTQFTDDPAPEGLEIRTKVNSVNPLNWYRVGKELQRLRADLIVTRYWLPFMGPSLGTILKIAKKNSYTKTICIADNIIPHESRPGDRVFTEYFVKSIDKFIVMSKSVGEDIRQFTTTAPVKYIAHPIYDNYGALVDKASAKAHLSLDKEVDYLLFFGFIRDYKGLDILLDAMADARIQSRNIQLLVAGEYYSNEEKYLTQIQELGIGKQLVMRTKFIANEEVKYYFGAASLVTQTYKTATQSGISQLAYYFEKPMLVTNVGGLPEIVPHGECGYVVEVSAPAVADAILAYFDQEEELPMTQAVRERKKTIRLGYDGERDY